MNYITKLEKKLYVLGLHLSMCPTDFEAMDQYDQIEAELKDLQG